MPDALSVTETVGVTIESDLVVDIDTRQLRNKTVSEMGYDAFNDKSGT